MVLSKTINIKVNSRTFKKYKDLGYIFKTTGEAITIKYTDLSKYSEEEIEVQCDYCNKIFNRKYADHFKILNSSKQIVYKDACINCKVLKTKDVMLSLHGVESNFSLPEVRKKIIKTLQVKYGVVTNISQSKYIQEKIAINNLNKYGVISTSMLQSIKEKVKVANLKKFGAEYPILSDWYREYITDKHIREYGWDFPLSNPAIRLKAQLSYESKTGYKNPLCCPDVQSKILNSKYLNGNQTASKQQVHICNILNGELNYPFLKYYIDIAFPTDKVAIEYNGGGHDLSVKLGNIPRSKFIQNETFRKKQLYKSDWKLITYISLKDKLLSDDKILLTYQHAISELISGRHWVEIHIDTGKIITSKKTIDITQISLND